MTVPIDHSKLEPSDPAQEKAHIWRSECIQQFAKLELTVADALNSLRRAKPALKVKEGLPFKGAFDELVRCIKKTGASGQAVASSLEGIEPLTEWRAHLTHGVMEVWQGKKSHLLTLQHRTTGGGALRRHALSRDEADELLQQLSKEVRDLKSRLGQLRTALNPASA